MRIYTTILVTLVLVGVCFGCKKLSPTKSWRDFDATLIRKQYDEVGAWGGLSYIHWESENAGTFNVQLATNFGVKHGWKFVSQQAISKDTVRKWVTWKSQDIFPLGYSGFAPDINDSIYEKFPRWISEDLTLLKFDTHWITALGGIDKPAYAYVLISTDGKKMALYHLWGE